MRAVGPPPHPGVSAEGKTLTGRDLPEPVCCSVESRRLSFVMHFEVCALSGEIL